MPVVMISSLTEHGCETTLRALELGAVDFIGKPLLSQALIKSTHQVIAIGTSTGGPKHCAKCWSRFRRILPAS